MECCEPLMSSDAALAWERLGVEERRRLIEVGWCGYCTDPGPMAPGAAWVKDGYLILDGTCTRCGNAVTRFVECSPVRP